MNCTSNNNGNRGIWASNSAITNCTANRNDRGIRGVYTTITNCTANNNMPGGGISALVCTIINCTASHNGASGFEVDDSTISNCTSYSNNDHGIYPLTQNRIEGNNLIDNGFDGTGYAIYIPDGNGLNYVIKNTASNNTTGGFRVPDGIINYVPICGVGDPTDNCNYDF